LAVVFWLFLFGFTLRKFFVAGTWSLDEARILNDGLIAGLVGGLFTLLLAIVTGLLVYLAYIELSDLSETSSANLIFQFTRDFYKEQARTLMTLIERRWIKFAQREKDWWFEVDTAAIARSNLPNNLKGQLGTPATYSVHDVDGLLLGHLEDVGTFTKKGNLRKEIVYSVFGRYVQKVWENNEIKDYIKAKRIEEEEQYTNFEWLYDECRRIKKTPKEQRQKEDSKIRTD
jgi:hypothetical protein